MTDLATLLTGLVLANFFVLVPLLSTESPGEPAALPMGLAAALALLPAAAFTCGAATLLLAPLGLPELAPLLAVAAAFAVAPAATRLVRRVPVAGPATPAAAGALAGVNSGIMAVALLAMDRLATLASALAWAALAGAGFLAVTVLFGGLRERLEAAEVPAALRGPAIALITAGFFSLALGGVGTVIRG